MTLQTNWGWAFVAGGLLLLGGCPKPMAVNEEGDAPADAGSDEAEVEAEAEAKVFAVPQESLEKDKTAIKVSGTISIDGYEKGIIQLDVTRAEAGSKSVQPVTIARYKKPGPFTLYLPAGTEEIYLYSFLDIESNGPTVDDPRGEYAENPLILGGKGADGIGLVIDMANVQQPPPEDRSDQRPGAKPGTGEGDLTAKTAAEGEAVEDQAAALSETPQGSDTSGEAQATEAPPPPPTPKPEAAQAPPPPAPAPEADSGSAESGDMLSQDND